MADGGGEGPSRGIAVLLIILIVGMVAVFAVLNVTSQTDDPRTHSHQYVAEGTHNDVPVTGTGSTTYYNEGQASYVYKLSVSCTDSCTFDLTVIMDKDGKIMDAYDELVHIGTEAVDGVSCEHWFLKDHHGSSVFSVDLWVGSSNTVTKSIVSGDGWELSVFLADPVSSVSFDVSVVQISAGSSRVLTPVLYPSHAPSTSCVWSSSDVNVATVDQNGTVTAVGPVGSTCTVTVTVNGHSASVPVVVTV